VLEELEVRVVLEELGVRVELELPAKLHLEQQEVQVLLANLCLELWVLQLGEGLVLLGFQVMQGVLAAEEEWCLAVQAEQEVPVLAVTLHWVSLELQLVARLVLLYLEVVPLEVLAVEAM
jgi:hypothetical protein